MTHQLRPFNSLSENPILYFSFPSFFSLLFCLVYITRDEGNELLLTELLPNRVPQLLGRKTIGKGTFGKVKKAIHRHTGEPVAIKILEKDKIKDITDVERVSRELHILKLVRHSSIAQLYEIIESNDRIFIVMEYAQNGEFFDYIMDGRVYPHHDLARTKERPTTISHRSYRD